MLSERKWRWFARANALWLARSPIAADVYTTRGLSELTQTNGPAYRFYALASMSMRRSIGNERLENNL